MTKEVLQKSDGRQLIFYSLQEDVTEGSRNWLPRDQTPQIDRSSALRWDPILREWVTYAPQRQDRTFLPPDNWCPLCPTKLDGVPTEVPRSQYDLVVFENRFPSYSLDAPAPSEVGSVLTPTRPRRGICEVVLYTDNHQATLAELDEQRIERLIDVWTDRYRNLGALPEIQYVLPFENKGEAVGVTLRHPHGQIYGYPFIPPRPARELEAAREYRATHDEACLHCAVLAQEQSDGRRLVIQSSHVTAFVPFFAHYPYEVHLYTQRCVPSLVEFTRAERQDLARVLKRVLSSYDALWGFSLPYLLGVHQAPTDGQAYHGLAHFHLEIYPPHRTPEKLKYLAGSEALGGAYVMDALPETTAAYLRGALETLPGRRTNANSTPADAR
jgi:UDPglucose--hexose-1-phosphate uridylyltransferase